MKRSGLVFSLILLGGIFGTREGLGADSVQPPPHALPEIPTRTAIAPPGEPSPDAQAPAVRPTHPPPGVTPIIVPAPPGPLPDGILAFDAESKEMTAKTGEPEARFTFCVTNLSAADVTIREIRTSCGCTVARLPASPWILTPGSNGEFSAIMNIAGKAGTIVKTVTVMSDKGQKTLMVKSTILPPVMSSTDRDANLKLAQADRQAVFKGDCASCHVTPAIGKMGHELYTTACGVCHEAEHRAAMVPNLHALTTPTNADYWKNWITQGKDGSLMPAFGQAHGGFLTEEQITSLVDYLSETFPSRSTAQAATPQNTAPKAH